MQMVKIKFNSHDEEVNGIYELMRRGKVICFPNGIYELPEELLSVLMEKNIKYTVLKKEGEDYAHKALRDSSASKV